MLPLARSSTAKADSTDPTTIAVGLLNNQTYYWHVRSHNAGGDSAWSAAWSFTTVPAIADAPVLSAPSDLSTDIALDGTLEWNAATGADSYTVEIATDNTFNNVVDTQTGLTGTSATPSGLLNSTTYYWRVSAVNTGGSSTSEIWSFTTVPAIADVPTLTAPTNNATDIPLDGTLEWNMVTGADTYSIEIATDATFSTIIDSQSGLTDPTTIAVGLLNNQTYYWHVRSHNAGGDSDWSPAWSFTTVPAIANVPTLAAPTNNATDIALDESLSWSAVTGADSYRVQVSELSDFSTIVLDQSGITGTTATLSGLSNSTTYYWRVLSHNAGGDSAWSAAWSFTTVPAIADAPILSAPLDLSTDVALDETLSWSVVSGVGTYTLEIAADNTFATPVDTQAGLTGTTATPLNLANNTTYYWRVSAVNTGGSSTSEIWSFTTVPAIADVPILTAPANNATDIPLDGTLEWNIVTGADTYSIEIATDATFSTIIDSQSGLTDPTTIAVGLLNNQIYYWHVRSHNAGGDSAWSFPWSFTTVPAVADAPILTAPSDLSTAIALDEILGWDAVTGADSYQVQVSELSDFSTIVLDQSGITGITATLSGLSNSTTYYWRVLSHNAGGDSAWSSPWSFTTVPAIADVPTLTSPTNNATDIALDESLSWSAVTGADSYRVQVSELSDFSTTVLDQSGITGTTAILSGLSNSTTYYWRVLSHNAGGDSLWSSTWSFTTVPGIADAPVLSAPSDLSTDVALDGSLEWNATTGADSYTVEIATDNTFNNLVDTQTGLTGITATPAGLLNNQTYYWHVRSHNAGGDSAWSAAWSFTTVPAIADVPTLTAPINNATDIALDESLSWSAVTGADSYWVQVSELIDFSTTVLDQSGITGTIALLSGFSNSTTYYWRVLSHNAGGDSAWSAAWSFTTVPAIADAPILTAPLDLSTEIALDGTLEWNAATGADSYIVEIATDNTFNNVVDTQNSLTGTSATPSGLLNSTTYYWRVSAVNAGGSSISETWSFTTVPAIADVPTLTAPSNLSTDIALDGALEWNMVTGADTYSIEIATDATFSTIIDSQSGLTDLTTIAAGLLNNQTYYWHVRSHNAGGDSAWSGAWSFTTVPAIADAPVLSAPLDLSTDIALNGTLEWNAATGADSYTVEIATDNTFNNVVDTQTGLTGTSATPSGLLNSTTYYWRVSAVNTGGSSTSEIWSFTTVPAIADVPTLTAPTNNATDIPLDGTLEWNMVTGADTYSIEIATDATFSTIIDSQSGLTDLTTIPAGLLNNETYYWHVLSHNAGGDSAWSAAWSFTTVPAIADVPTLTAPSNNATDIALDESLSWNAVTGADSYRVQVSELSDFSTIVLDQSGITGTTATLSGLSNSTTYYWRVLSHNAGGDSAWSAAWSFTTVPAIADVPTLTAPTNTATDIPLDGTLEWTPATGADTYQVQVSASIDFSTNVLDQSGITGTTTTLSGLSNSITYYWRVLSHNAGGDSPWSSTWSFTTIPAIADAPILSAPSDLSTDIALDGTLEWNAAIGADSYTVEIATDNTFNNVVDTQTGLTGTSATPSGLLNSTTYYWRVSAVNTGGSSTSGIWSFTTVPAIADVPTLTAPTNTATDIALDESLSWDAVTGADSYRVQVSELSDFSTTVLDQSGITGTTATLSGLSNSITYYWRVLSHNAGGDSAWSAAWSFTTVPAIADVPALSAPSDLSTDVALDESLSWNAVTGADSYRVQVSELSDFSTTVLDQSGITGTTATLSGLSNSTTYYWRVLSHNAGGDSLWSAAWSFTTVPAIADAPVLSAPSDLSTDVALDGSLEWNAATGADSYTVEIATDNTLQ